MNTRCNKTVSAILKKWNYNVFIIDWAVLLSGPFYYYPAAVMKSLHPASEHVANFIIRLFAETGLDHNQLHLVGHSLGAHLAGYTGRSVGVVTGRKGWPGSQVGPLSVAPLELNRVGRD
ncbi:unnamed protein product [Sphagnum tenellum]